MPEFTCLHLQDRESAAIHVVEIPWISVRIGRALYCEVRLVDRTVADEACRLQRRGRTWYLVPLGPKGSIWVYDEPIEGPCPLPFDVPFRVGGSCLTLRRSRSSDPDWEMYQTPLPSHGEWPSVTKPAIPPCSNRVSNGAASIRTSRPQVVPAEPPKAASGSRLEPASSRPAGSESVNSWEARWKAAGALLRAAAEQPRTHDRPHSPQLLDGYSTISLKERSVPLSRLAELSLTSTALHLRGLETNPSGMTSASACPAPPSVVASVRPTSYLTSKPLAQSAEFQQNMLRRHLPEPEVVDENPASLEPPLPETTVMDSGHGLAICEEELGTCVVSMEEADLERSETGLISSPSHDLSEWTEYYLPAGSSTETTDDEPSSLEYLASNSAPGVIACPKPIVHGVAIFCAENDSPATLDLPRYELETSPGSSLESLFCRRCAGPVLHGRYILV